MADSVDDRVVAMHFDNAAFESKIQETIASLGKFQKSLDFTSSIHNLADLNSAGQNVRLDGIASAVDNISSKFSAMGVTAFTVISNLTNRMVDAGLNFGKQFAFGPIMDGFGEMETKVGSIQTILANTARFNTGLPEVTASLDELNTYSDKTIYDFGEMTKNIGLFTNAGIKIGDATKMIEGFSNVAAASGTTAEGAAGAAYQLSQALSTGKVTLMDWRSLTNVGMGNKNMQDGLIQIADAMGTLNKTGVKASDVQANFNGTLEKGWLTADVMSTYLRIMAGDMDTAKLKALGLSDATIKTFQEQQKTAEDAATKVRTFTQLVGTVKEAIGSGWAQSFELVLGDFNQATDLFTEMNNSISGIIGRLSDARNAALKVWADAGGRTKLIQAFKDIFGALVNVVNAFRFAFQIMFHGDTGKTLLTLTDAFAKFAAYLKDLTWRIRFGFVPAWGLVFAVVKLVMSVVKGATSFLYDLFKALIPDHSGSSTINFFGKILAVLQHLVMALNSGVIDAFKVLHAIIIPVAKGFAFIADKISTFVTDLIRTSVPLSAIGRVFSDVKNGFGAFIDLIKRGASPLASLEQVFGDIGVKMAGFLHEVQDELKKFGAEAAQVFGVVEAKVAGFVRVIESAFKVVAAAAVQVYDVLFHGNFVGGPFQEDSGFIEKIFKVRDALISFADLVKRIFNSIDVSGAIKTLGGVFDDLKDKVSGFFSSVSGGNTIHNFDSIIEKLSGVNDKSKLLISTITAQDLGGDIGFKKMVGEIDGQASLLDRTLQKIKDVWTSFLDVMGGVGEKFKGVGEKIKDGVKNIFSKISSGDINVNQILDVFDKVLFAAFLISLRKFINNFGDLVNSAEGVFKQLSKTLKNFGQESKPDQLIKIAVALGIITASLVVLSTVDHDKLVKALEAMSAGFVELFGMLKAMDKFIKDSTGVAKTATAVVLIAVGMDILATAMTKLSKLSWEELAKGLAGVAGGLTAMGIAVGLMKNNLDVSTGITILALATAVLILAEAVNLFSKMNVVELTKGLAAITVALVVIGKTVGDMGPGLILAAPGVVILAGAMLLMADAVKKFAGIDMYSLIKGLGAIAVALGIVAVTVGDLPPSFFLVAAGFPHFAKGLQAIGDAVQQIGSMAVATLLEGLIGMGAALTVIVVAVNAMSGALAGAAAMVIVAGALLILAKVLKTIGEMKISELATAIAALTVVLLGLAAAGVFLSAPLAALGAALILVGAGFALFGGGAYLAAIAFKYLVETASGNIDALIGVIDKFVSAIPHFIATFVSSMADNAGQIVDSFDKIIKAIEDMVIRALKAVVNIIPQLSETINAITEALVQFLLQHMPEFVAVGFAFVQSVGDGLMANIGELTQTAIVIITELLDTLAQNAPSLVNSGVNLILALLKGLGMRLNDILTAGQDLIIQFIYGIASKSLAIIRAGADVLIQFLYGLAATIREKAPEIRAAGLEVALAIIDGITGGLLDTKNLKKVIEGMKGLAGKMIDAFKTVIPFASPSPLFFDISGYIAQGLANGLNEDKLAENAAVRHAERIVEAFHKTLSEIPDALGSMDEFNPVVTPVLDLTQVKMGAKNLSGLMSVGTITPEVSLAQARALTTTAPTDVTSTDVTPAPKDVTFIQNINAPKALSTNDIYRNTKSQIALAKEELGIS